MNGKRFLKFGEAWVLIVGALVLLSSCTVQQNTASRFGAYADSVAVLVLPPQFLQKSSLTIQRLYPQFSRFSPDLQDTVWAHHAKLLDLVPDSVMIDRYRNSLLAALQKSGMHVYDGSQLEAFNSDRRSKYIFRIAQFQLEEDRRKVDFSEELDNQEELYKDMEISVLSLNVWFEMLNAVADTAPAKVLFAQKMTSDVVDGRFFSTKDNQYEFRFKRVDLNRDSVVTLSAGTGAQNAQQITDYVFTRYIKTQFPETGLYFGYDLNLKTIYYPSPANQLKEITIP